MRLISVFTLIVLALAGLAAPSARATYEGGFADVNVNRLFWSQATQDKSTKKDFNYLELEGGGQFSWGEMYGFFDIENPGRDAQDVRTAGKAVVRYYLGASHVSLFAQVYDFHSRGFAEQNRVLGLGYQLTGTGWWFKPFLGVHDVTQTYFSGLNGFMGGWAAGYSFVVAGQNFLVADWHELEFARNELYAAGNGDAKVSQNGAASVWWNANSVFSLGLQWRYAVNKLGTEGGLNAGIVTARFAL